MSQYPTLTDSAANTQSSAATSYTVGSVVATPLVGHFCVLTVPTEGVVEVSGVSGLGGTWVRLLRVANGATHGLEFWAGYAFPGASATNGLISISYSASTARRAAGQQWFVNGATQSAAPTLVDSSSASGTGTTADPGNLADLGAQGDVAVSGLLLESGTVPTTFTETPLAFYAGRYTQVISGSTSSLAGASRPVTTTGVHKRVYTVASAAWTTATIIVRPGVAPTPQSTQMHKGRDTAALNQGADA